VVCYKNLSMPITYKKAASRWCQITVLGCFMLAVTGCETVHDYSLTYRLWDTDDFNRWSEPTRDPNLALFETKDHSDVLAQYDAYSEKRSAVIRQAYYLHSSEAQVAAGKKPVPLNPAMPEGATPILVLDPKVVGTNQPPHTPPYAITTRPGREFTLYESINSGLAFQLPVYAESSGTFPRVALTPFAVVGDTVMVGAVVSVVAVVLWAQGGGPVFWR
jgi:hypothetical protein